MVSPGGLLWVWIYILQWIITLMNNWFQNQESVNNCLFRCIWMCSKSRDWEQKKMLAISIISQFLEIKAICKNQALHTDDLLLWATENDVVDRIWSPGAWVGHLSPKLCFQHLQAHTTVLVSHFDNQSGFKWAGRHWYRVPDFLKFADTFY